MHAAYPVAGIAERIHAANAWSVNAGDDALNAEKQCHIYTPLKNK
jgi:hypothetical protein